MSQPLDNLKVLDLTHVLAGPFCSYMLALHGADVVKIEAPDCPDCVRGRGPDVALNASGMGTNYLTQGSNKRAITLNLKQHEGRTLFLRLLKDADVLVENFRSGALAELGLDTDSLQQHNPRLVHASLTGYGQTGPRATVNAYDNVIQAASGLMAMTGPDPQTPTKLGASAVDYASGLAAAFAILLALKQRDQTGSGVHIDCSMLDTAMMFMGTQVTAHYAGAPAPRGKGANAGESGLGCYDTADGKLMLGAFNARQHERLWNSLGRPDLAAHSSWEAMAQNASDMRSVLSTEFAKKTAEELETWLHGIGVPAERVRSIEEAIGIAELQGRPTTAELPICDSSGRPVRVPLAPFTMSSGGATIESPPPRHGEHTTIILEELGLEQSEIAALQERGVV